MRLLRWLSRSHSPFPVSGHHILPRHTPPRMRKTSVLSAKYGPCPWHSLPASDRGRGTGFPSSRTERRDDPPRSRPHRSPNPGVREWWSDAIVACTCGGKLKFPGRTGVQPCDRLMSDGRVSPSRSAARCQRRYDSEVQPAHVTAVVPMATPTELSAASASPSEDEEGGWIPTAAHVPPM